MKEFALEMAGAMLASRIALAQVYASRFLREPDPMEASRSVREEMKRQLLEQQFPTNDENAEIDRMLYAHAAEHLDRLFDQIDVVVAATELKQSGSRLV